MNTESIRRIPMSCRSCEYWSNEMQAWHCCLEDKWFVNKKSQSHPEWCPIIRKCEGKDSLKKIGDVMKGLECCTNTYLDYEFNCESDDCPYKGIRQCIPSLVGDAYEHLKILMKGGYK